MNIQNIPNFPFPLLLKWILLSFIITILSCVKLSAQEDKLVRIRIARSTLCWNCPMPNDRIYTSQIDIDLEQKKVFKRRNESKKFKPTKTDAYSKKIFNSNLIDSLISYNLEQAIDLNSLYNNYSKEYIYKIEFYYSSKNSLNFPISSKTIQLSKYHLNESKNNNDSILNLINFYENLWKKNKFKFRKL